MKSLRTVLIFSLSFLSCLAVVQAQTQGRITGRVVDTTGAVIVKARVTIENRATHVQRVLETNTSGDYVAPGIEAGMYSISVEASNFRKVVTPCKLKWRKICGWILNCPRVPLLRSWR